MKQRDFFYDQDAIQKLKTGIDALSNMVKVTLGPKGNNVIIERNSGGPLITKDGVTVAREVFLEDSVENMGAQLLKEVASKTNETAGDGTTTATVLAQALISEGIKNVVAGANPIDLKRGMDIAVKEISKKLREISKTVQNKEDIVNVASISANNDYEIGNIIAEAIDKAGNEGIVIVEDAKGVETFTDIVEGMQFDRGYKYAAYINKKSTMEVELQNTYILIYNGTLQQVPALANLMKQVYEKGNSSLLVIADDFSEEMNKLLLLNSSTVKGSLSCCTVISPGHGDRRVDLLNDIAAFTGGTVYGNELFPITQATLQTLGKADKIIIDKNKTVIIGGKGSSDKIKERIDQIRYLLDNTAIDYDRQKLQERLGKLTGGIVILRVGSVTETELKEKKMRIEDALHATRAALEEGIVPGEVRLY
jgi:chaperonin GroEL